MELGPEERYAAAALFTLALHLTQVEGGQNGDPETAWGQTDDPPTSCSTSATDAAEELERARWAAFWGWDCCAAGGLLDNVYQALGIPDKSWSALKHLPEVGGLSRKERNQYMRVVASYMGMLDAELPTLHVLGKQEGFATFRDAPTSEGLIPDAPRARSAASSRHGDAAGGPADTCSPTAGPPSALLDDASVESLSSLGVTGGHSSGALGDSSSIQGGSATSMDRSGPLVAQEQETWRTEQLSESVEAFQDQAVQPMPAVTRPSARGQAIHEAAGAAGRLEVDQASLLETGQAVGPAPAQQDAEEPGSCWNGVACHGERFEAMLADSDSDLEEDLAAVHLAEHILEEHRCGGDQAQGRNSEGSHGLHVTAASLRDCHSAPLNSPEEGIPASQEELPLARDAVPWESTDSTARCDPCDLLRPSVFNNECVPSSADTYGTDGNTLAASGSEPAISTGKDSRCAVGGETCRGDARDAQGGPRRLYAESSSRESPGAVSLKQEGAGFATCGMGDRPATPRLSGIGEEISRAKEETDRGQFRAAGRRSGKGAAPSPKALGATWELLEGCLFRPVDEGGNACAEADGEGGNGAAEAPFPPKVRWYDARHRVALKRVALWLNVPWSKVAAYEQLLAYRLLLPNGGNGARPPTNAWEVGLRAAAIGATTVGVGALFALTGGLAAPAIAGGVFNAITAAGGSLAIAGGVSGFLNTVAGTAVVASGVGAAGGTFAGTRMANRIGRVKEFGFWEVLPNGSADVAGDPTTPPAPSMQDGGQDSEEKFKLKGKSPTHGAGLQKTRSFGTSRSPSTSHRRCVSNDAVMEAGKPLGRSPPRAGRAARHTTRSPRHKKTDGLDFDFLSATACDSFPHPPDSASQAEETELHPIGASSPDGAHGIGPSSEGVSRDPNASPSPAHHRRGSSILAQLDLGDSEEERLLFGDGFPGPDAGADLFAQQGSAGPKHRRAESCPDPPDKGIGVFAGRPLEACHEATTTSAVPPEPPNRAELFIQTPSVICEGPALREVSAESAALPASPQAASCASPTPNDPCAEGPIEALLGGDHLPAGVKRVEQDPDRKVVFTLASLFRTSGRPQAAQAATPAAASSEVRGSVVDTGHLQAPASPPGPAGPRRPFRAAGLPGLGSDSEAEELLFGSKLTDTSARREASTVSSRRGGNGLLQQASSARDSNAERGADSELEEDLFGPCSPATASLPSRYLEHRKRLGPGSAVAGARGSDERAATTVRWVRNWDVDSVSAAGRATEGAAELPRCTSSREEDPLMAAGLEERISDGEGRGDGETGEAEERSKSSGCSPRSAAGAGQGASGKDEAASRQSRWAWRGSRKKREPHLLPAPVSLLRQPGDMRLSVTIGVNGWIKEREDYITMWAGLEGIIKDSEVFTLVWESRELRALNNALISFMAQQAGQEVVKYALTHFFYTGMVAAFAWPVALVSFSQFIDHAWVVVMDRAQKAGQLLAHLLLAGLHGDRPVVLIGYSMGARLVFHCLLELCRHNAKGLVETAVLVGVPVSTRRERWAMARRAVAGRFINGYSQRDWVLGLVYRLSNGLIKEAGGLCPVDCPGIENVNLSSIIAGHFDYIQKMPEILDLIGLYD